jgi:hypothetical protein
VWKYPLANWRYRQQDSRDQQENMKHDQHQKPQWECALGFMAVQFPNELEDAENPATTTFLCTM